MNLEIKVFLEEGGEFSLRGSITHRILSSSRGEHEFWFEYIKAIWFEKKLRSRV